MDIKGALNKPRSYNIYFDYFGEIKAFTKLNRVSYASFVKVL